MTERGETVGMSECSFCGNNFIKIECEYCGPVCAECQDTYCISSSIRDKLAQQEALLTLYRGALEQAKEALTYSSHCATLEVDKALALTPEEALKIMTETGEGQ